MWKYNIHLKTSTFHSCKLKKAAVLEDKNTRLKLTTFIKQRVQESSKRRTNIIL